MTCEVVVLYFARSAELTGLRTERVSVPQQITSLQLWEEIEKRHSRLADIKDQVIFAIRQEYVLLGDQLLVLHTGDEVAIIPPLSGGITRNNFEGRKVIQLEYEAYTAMAEAELKKICKDIRLKWPSVKHIAVHHRLGLVPISEASVIIAISSPHRAESLEALQYCISALKATVPIWKKEIYEEESFWKVNKECFWIKREK